MRSLTFALSLCLSLASVGQQNTFGLTGGPSLSRLRGNAIFKQVDPIMGFQFGGQYTHWFKCGFGVQGQFSYVRMGGALDYIGFNDVGLESSRDKIIYHLNHIGLSLGADYRTPGRVHGLFSLGLMPSMIAGAEVRSPDTFYHPGAVVVTDLTEKMSSPVLFGFGAFGGAVDLKAPISIGLLVRYDQGLTTLSRNDFFEAENLIESSWSMSLTIGYRWAKN